MAFHDRLYASQGLQGLRRLRVFKSTRLTTSKRLIATTKVIIAINFTTATSFTMVTKSLINKTATMTMVKIGTAIAASKIVGHTSFPKVGLFTSQTFKDLISWCIF